MNRRADQEAPALPGPGLPEPAGAEPGVAAPALADPDQLEGLWLKSSPPPGVPRRHVVTAVVVARDGAEWLPRTLGALAAQRRPPEQRVGVAVRCADQGEELLRAALPQVVAADPAQGLAGALAAGLDVPIVADAASRLATGGPARLATDGVAHAAADGVAHRALDGGAPQEWLWILHDDSAPQPGCLAALLDAADRHPDAQVLVPKSVGWSDSSRLMGIGNRWAPGHPVVERLEPGERDQGQYDTERTVFSGDSAGMLVSMTAWQRLSGMVGPLGSWGGAADLCRRVWSTGGQVVFAPEAVVAHRSAGRTGRRRPPDLARTPRPHAPRRDIRHQELLLELTQVGGLRLAARWLRGWLTSLLRALLMLLTREPEEASAELAGAWAVLAHPGRLRAARAAVRATGVHPIVRPDEVRARRGTVALHAMDWWVHAPREQARSLRQRPVSRASLMLAGTVGALCVASLIVSPTTLIGSGAVSGGGLLPAPDAGALLHDHLSSWRSVRFGVPTEQPAYLPLLALASLPLLGSVDLLLRLLITFAVPLAFVSAYASSGPLLLGRHRVTAALLWSLLPAGVAAAGAGRLSTLAVLLLGPPTARLLARAWQRARAGDRAIRPAIAAGTLLGVLGAFAPLTLALVLVLALGAWILAGLPRWPLRAGLITVACALAFVALWLPSMVRTPWLLVAEVGRNDPVLAASGTPLIAGLSPGGPTAVGWIGLPLLLGLLVVVLLCAPVRRYAAALLGCALLLVGAAWLPWLVATAWPQAPSGVAWAGQPLLLSSGMLVVLAARAVAVRMPLGIGFRAGLGDAGLLVCAVLVVVAWWAAASLVRVSPASALPAVSGLAAQTPDQPRTLALLHDGDVVRYAVSARPEVQLGDADALAVTPADAPLAEIVRTLVSGAGGDVSDELAARAIRFVWLSAGPGDEVTARLDAAPGMRRLSSSIADSLWLVTDQPVRAQLAPVDGSATVPVPVTTSPTSIHVVLDPAAQVPTVLSVAEQADAGWQGTLGGVPIALSADQRGLLTAELDRTGELVVTHRSAWSWLAAGQCTVMLGLMVLSLPKRRPASYASGGLA